MLISDTQPTCAMTVKAVGKVETIRAVQRLRGWGQGCETGEIRPLI